MEDEARVPGSFSGEPTCSLGASSFWLDACEDISCDIINDFVDFHASIAPGSSVEHTSDQNNIANDFFGGIDHILDSIKNGGSLSPAACNGDRDCTLGEGFFIENEASGVRDVLVDSSTVQTHGEQIEILQCNGLNKDSFDNGSHICERYESAHGFKQPKGSEEPRVVQTPINGVKKHEVRNNALLRDRGCDSEERSNKRPRISNGNNERHYSNRGQCQSKDREKCYSRKRLRERDEIDRRDRGCFRRREHYGTSGRDARDRDWREREQKGYWERDKSGSNEMVFRSGMWEVDRNREATTDNDKNLELQGTAEESSQEIKEKLPEEQARQYQLDVLEQAKKKNTIAFLETGAGKTLIAVLLIKSIYTDLQTQNKKMLAVFLVPKVPLVYQVKYVINA